MFSRLFQVALFLAFFLAGALAENVGCRDGVLKFLDLNAPEKTLEPDFKSTCVSEGGKVVLVQIEDFPAVKQCIGNQCSLEDYKALLEFSYPDVKVIDPEENLILAKLQRVYRKLL